MVACGGGGGGGSDATGTPGVVVETTPAAVTDLSATASGDTITLSFKVADPQNVSSFKAVCTGSGPALEVTSPSHGGSTDTISVSGLTDALSYSCSVTAINSSGAGTATSAVQATPGTDTTATPSKPASVTVTAGPQSAVVTFTESSANGGAAVSGYVATCSNADGTQVASAYGVSSPIVVAGLVEGVSYSCTVSGINAQGVGTPSDTSSATQVVPAPAVAPASDAPARPNGVAATRGAASATVSFDAVETAALYRATCARDDGNSTVSAESATSPITVPGLTNGRPYACSVTVTTAAGTSAASDAVSVVPATVPDEPILTKATGGNRFATLEFSAPQGDGGLSITGYHAVCTTDGKVATGDVTLAGSVVVAGLDNDSEYSCTVAAINGAGTGKGSNASKVTPTAPTTPVTGGIASMPALGQVTAGNGSATFTATTTSTSPVLDYTVTCTDASSATPPVSVTSATVPITVAGLSGTTTYSCVVTARTEAGTSDPSAPQVVAPTATVPKAPTPVSATPGNASIAVAFTFLPGDDGGAAVSKFTATCGDKPGSGSGSPVTVEGLVNGKTYTCSMTATNAMGTSERSSTTVSAKPSTVPQKPTSVSAIAGVSTITLAYAAPQDNGGADILDFTGWCQSRIAGSTLYKATSVTKTDTSITVPVLPTPDGSTYDCWVTARNSVDSSEPSDKVAATPTAAVIEAAPDAATNLQMSIGDKTLTVTFDRPASNGADVSYALICSPGDINKAALNGSATATNLTNGTSYSCRVRATRGSKYTDASFSTAGIPNTLPTAPALGTVAAANQQLTIPFTKPAGNSSDTTYGANCGAGSVASGESIFVITGLTNGQTYSCTVTATNSMGDASVSTSGTPATIPDAPALSITAGTASAGSASLTVTVTPPANNGGSAVTGYTLTCDGGLSFTPTTTALSKTFTGLPNATKYTCSVKASNNVGAGASSGDVSATTGVSVPGAPSLSLAAGTASAGNASLTITVTPPTNNGGSAVTGYALTCGGGLSFTPTTTTLSKTFTGLPNAAKYTCSVKASNNVGAGASSGDVSATTGVSVPGAPTNVGLSQCNGTTDTLYAIYAAPQYDGGNTINNYLLELYIVNGQTESLISGPRLSTSSPVSFNHVQSNTTYRVKVYAKNGNGAGPSASADVKTGFVANTCTAF